MGVLDEGEEVMSWLDSSPGIESATLGAKDMTAAGDLPLFKLVTEMAMEAPGLLLRGSLAAAGGIARATTAIGAAANNMGQVALSSAGVGTSATPEAPAPSMSPAVAAPAQACVHEVSVEELGNLAPPSIGDCAQGAGIGQMV